MTYRIYAKIGDDYQYETSNDDLDQATKTATMWAMGGNDVKIVRSHDLVSVRFIPAHKGGAPKAETDLKVVRLYRAIVELIDCREGSACFTETGKAIDEVIAAYIALKKV